MPNSPIVNELLCFVVNEMNVLPCDCVVKLCSYSYRNTEIEAANQIAIKLSCADKWYPERKD